MGKFKKTPFEKLITKLEKLSSDPAIRVRGNIVSVRDKVILEYTEKKIYYSKIRYFPTKKIDIVEDLFTVEIPLTHENLTLLSTNPINPPRGARKIVDLFNAVSSKEYTHIKIGAYKNVSYGKRLSITTDLYKTLLEIDKEEGLDKKIRVQTRVSPFLKNEFGLTVNTEEIQKDYSLLLQEVLASGEFTQADLIALAKNLDEGYSSKIVINTQINKQVTWLIDTIEELLDETNLTRQKSKDFGSQKFGYSKVSITGPEHLMEKILTDYGQHTLFGVPALLNTNKYVLTDNPRSRSQFDIILINHLGDIEVVELKRSDETVLDYDESRNKFFPSKSLSVAIAQAERYISIVNKDNDDDYLINGRKIRDFISEKVGNTLFIESVRPSALIIIGSWQTLTKPHSKISPEKQQKITKENYDENGLRAYREIKNSYKNIKLMNYSELLEHARTRLEIEKSSEPN